MLSEDLLPHEVPYYYQEAIRNYCEYPLFIELEASLSRFVKFVQELPMDKFDYVYENGKWDIKQIIQHVIDCERIFAARAVFVARGYELPLASFDQNQFVDSVVYRRSIRDLLNELTALRHSNLFMFKSFSSEELLRVGSVQNYTFSVRGIGFMMVAHLDHHRQIFIERYL